MIRVRHLRAGHGAFKTKSDADALPVPCPTHRPSTTQILFMPADSFLSCCFQTFLCNSLPIGSFILPFRRERQTPFFFFLVGKKSLAQSGRLEILLLFYNYFILLTCYS